MHGPTCIFWANLAPFSLVRNRGCNEAPRGASSPIRDPGSDEVLMQVLTRSERGLSEAHLLPPPVHEAEQGARRVVVLTRPALRTTSQQASLRGIAGPIRYRVVRPDRRPVGVQSTRPRPRRAARERRSVPHHCTAALLESVAEGGAHLAPSPHGRPPLPPGWAWAGGLAGRRSPPPPPPPPGR
jgi:hypothetical protein